MEYLPHWKCGVAISLFILQVISECFALQSSTSNTNNNSSHPLILTPYIRNGRLEEARRASEVTDLPGIGNALRSYSGFFTVNEQYNSNMFFWFFPPLNGDPNCPFILYLFGGPGLTSLIGIFDENGPFQVDANGTPSFRNYTWNREFALLYIDNPVGTGFSFTENDLGYSRNQTDISRNVYSVLQQFFVIFPEYQANAFFVAGLSYACKYIATLAQLIHEQNQLPNRIQINLSGHISGSGFCNPRVQFTNYADYLFQVGLIDQIQWRNFTEQQIELSHLIDSGQYLDAYQFANSFVLGFTRVSYQHNTTGLAALSMLNDPVYYSSLAYLVPYIQRPETRRALHVGTQLFSNGTRVLQALESDIVQSVQPSLEFILNRNYATLFYNGNMDILTNTPSVEKMLLGLNWKGAARFKQASQHIYRITNDTVAGYVRQSDNLYFMIVRNAGHMVQFDQPAVTYDIVTRFVRAIANCTSCQPNQRMVFV